MVHISPYFGDKHKEVEELYLNGGITWMFNPKDLAEEDQDNEWLIKELVREQIGVFKDDWFVVRGFMEVGDPWKDEEGRTVLELYPNDLFHKLHKTLKQGVYWCMINQAPDFDYTEKVIRSQLEQNYISMRIINAMNRCDFPELDRIKKEVILFKLAASYYDEADKVWRSEKP